jgi:RNA polymerase sigma factor (TIGR02999 family)
MPPPALDPAALLSEWRGGNRAALDRLFPLVYDDLRERARQYLRQQPAGHTLTTTALVHEAYLKLIGVARVPGADRAHFMALAAKAMRHVLIDYARASQTAKRGGKSPKPALQLDQALVLTDTGADQLLALHDALERLSAVSERLSRTVELRYFGGLTVDETAEALGLAPSTVKLDWQKARAWLYRELAEA